MKENRIAELRRQLGISQEKLAQELNVTQASISLYENGSSVPQDMLIAIAGFFDVSIDYLLNLQDNRYCVPIDNVSKSEYNILQLYRRLSSRNRGVVDKLIEILTESMNSQHY